MAKTGVKENKETETVFIPRRGKSDTERYVAVNGENMLVQTGKAVEVPKRFAEVINHSQKQDAEAEAFIETLAAGE